MKRQKPTRKKNRLFVATGAIATIIVIGGGAALALHLHHVHDAQKSNGTVGSVSTQTTTPPSDNKSQGTPTTSSGTSTSTDKDSGSSASSGSGSSTGTTTTAALIAPYGTFVSNHRPGQNGSPTTELSECTTTPGASCNITFTNASGVVKSLGAQTAGSDGTASWNWNVTGSNLAPGTWKVAATATLNGQTKTTADATSLEIE
ncbi:MAG TPA: hypothetical protein VIM53_04565 [Candidatus Saccharimonadales bacterium]